MITQYRVCDFQAFGQHFDIEYRFPDLDLLPEEGAAEDLADGLSMSVAAGRIDENSLNSGFRFTFSDLEILHSYESVSFGHAPLLLIIVLDGQVELKVGAVELTLESGMAASLQLHPDYALQAVQHPQPSLRAVTLAYDPQGADIGRAASPTLQRLLACVQEPLHRWSVPQALQSQLSDSFDRVLPELQQALVLEGLALQLVGLGVPEGQPLRETSPVSHQQQQRLELVRQQLEFSPEKDHTLAELAELAAMSQSGLRSKFRATYGVSVFEYRRQCRMALAQQFLERGFSVQQTAHKVGYRHATNFATAFRRHFGVSPKRGSTRRHI